MTEPITLDTEAAQQAVLAWRDYGDQVRAHGQNHHMTLDELRATVGDAYSPYVDAKQAELQARQAAYARAADIAHGHAQRLSNTATIFETTDDESAARITGLVDGSAESTGTQTFRRVSESTDEWDHIDDTLEHWKRTGDPALPAMPEPFNPEF